MSVLLKLTLYVGNEDESDGPVWFDETKQQRLKDFESHLAPMLVDTILGELRVDTEMVWEPVQSFQFFWILTIDSLNAYDVDCVFDCACDHLVVFDVCRHPVLFVH